VHPDLQKVIELQEADQKIVDLALQIEVIPSQIKKMEEQLGAFLHAHEERKNRLAANQKERRDLEGEIQVIRSKISKHKDQLYEVKTNEQYKTMLHEIEGEEQKIRKIEDRILEKMSEAEDLEKHVQDAAARLEGERTRVANEKKQLQSERGAAESAKREAEERRRALAAALGEPALRLYEKARKARGVAVVPVVDGSCSGCHVLLRPQAYNEVRSSGEIMTCESCGRILYYIESAVDKAAEGTRVVM
jgi:uncharacterized protein